MRHHNVNRKFGRTAGQRHALLRSLARSLFIRRSIRTTEAKAKELRPFVEKLVTRARVGTIASRRLLTARLGGDEGMKELLAIGKQMEGRAGGYTRITKLPRRMSDGSAMAVIEFV